MVSQPLSSSIYPSYPLSSLSSLRCSQSSSVWFGGPAQRHPPSPVCQSPWNVAPAYVPHQRAHNLRYNSCCTTGPLASRSKALPGTCPSSSFTSKHFHTGRNPLRSVETNGSILMPWCSISSLHDKRGCHPQDDEEAVRAQSTQPIL